MLLNTRLKRKPPKPPSFKAATDEINSANVKWVDFINQSLTITNNPSDKINKTEMLNLYKTQFPDGHATALILLASLKQNGITYDCQKEHNNVKGVYTGVIPKLEFKCVGEDINKYDKLKNENSKLYEQLEKQYKKIKELQRQLDQERFGLKPKAKIALRQDKRKRNSKTIQKKTFRNKTSSLNK